MVATRDAWWLDEQPPEEEAPPEEAPPPRSPPPTLAELIAGGTGGMSEGDRPASEFETPSAFLPSEPTPEPTPTPTPTPAFDLPSYEAPTPSYAPSSPDQGPPPSPWDAPAPPESFDSPALSGLTRAYNWAAGQVGPALDAVGQSPFGQALAGAVTPGGTLRQLGVGDRAISDVARTGLAGLEANVQLPQQLVGSFVQAAGQASGLLTPPAPGGGRTGAETFESALMNPALTFGAATGEVPEPWRGETVFQEAGMAPGPARTFAGAALEQTIDPANYLVGAERAT